MENVIKFFSDFINDLNAGYSESTLNILIAFLGVSAFIILMRIIVSSGYQTQYMILKSRIKKSSLTSVEDSEDDSEDETRKADKKDSKFGVIGKVMNDYRMNVEKGVVDVDTDALVKKYLYKMNFLGWGYPSIENFVKSFEVGIVLIGILVTVFLEQKEFYALTTIAIFIVLKILSCVFDFDLVKNKYLVESIEFVEREFATVANTTDIETSISKLRKEMYTAIMKQGDILKDSVEKLGSNLTGALALSISEMTKAVESSVEKATNFADELEKPLERWSESINNASMAQENLNLSFDSLKNMTDALNNSSVNLSNNYNSYFEKVTNQTESLNESMALLIRCVEELKDANENNRIDYNAVQDGLSYIEKNQGVLEQSLQQYENTLEGVTARMGETMGNIVDLQMQNSYKDLNDSLRDNIDSIVISNNDIILKLQDLFFEMQEQTRTQTQAIIKVKEQMDLQFDVIREKI